jgi:hypothetical protein
MCGTWTQTEHRSSLCSSAFFQTDLSLEQSKLTGRVLATIGRLMTRTPVADPDLLTTSEPPDGSDSLLNWRSFEPALVHSFFADRDFGW